MFGGKTFVFHLREYLLFTQNKRLLYMYILHQNDFSYSTNNFPADEKISPNGPYIEYKLMDNLDELI